MFKATKTRLFVFLSSLIYTVSSVPAENKLAEEISVPEPTHLQAAASAVGSELVWSEFLGNITILDSKASLAAIEVESLDGERVRGVTITLENSTSSDQIYITDSLLTSFRDELQELDYTRHWMGKCEAMYRCNHGIARCRPSETERQAYCPGRYTTSGSEEGFVLSTPRNTFYYPSVEGGQFDTFIRKAVLALD